MLQSLCTENKATARDTAHVASSLQQVHVDCSSRVYTFDAEDLYGCIDQTRTRAVGVIFFGKALWQQPSGKLGCINRVFH